MYQKWANNYSNLAYILNIPYIGIKQKETPHASDDKIWTTTVSGLNDGFQSVCSVREESQEHHISLFVFP